MREENNNYLGFALFFFAVVLIVLIGSIFLFFNNQNKKNERKIDDNQEMVLSDKMKKEKNQDFIYFTKEEKISDSLSIVNKYPIINLESEEASTTTNELKNYIETVKSTLKYTDESFCEDNAVVDRIYETKFLDFTVYSYQEYVTLLIRESNYSCLNGISPFSYVKSYTFNVLTGKKITLDELLKNYNTTMTSVIETIKMSLKDSQTIVDEEETIKIEETINHLKEQETFALYIDEFGDLVLNYVVKTNALDYNDTITIKER